MSIKIQINNLEALERLIGGDTQIEIDIRNSIVQEFTKKHLKGIATDNLQGKIKAQIIEETEKQFFDIKKGNWDAKIYTLKPHLKEIIEEYAKAHNKLFIEKLVKDSLQLEEHRKYIQQLLEKQAERIKAELTDKELESRLKKMVDVRLAEKLGIGK